MSVENLEDLFVQELSDMYSAEKQITKALPKLAKAASSDALARAFEGHYEETEKQVARLEKVADVCNLKMKRKKCEAMEGILEEGSTLIKEMDEGWVRDTALISAAQKVEHYEISAYLSLLKLAEQLGFKKALPLLLRTLEEEEDTDEKLSVLGDRNMNEWNWQNRSGQSQWTAR